ATGSPLGLVLPAAVLVGPDVLLFRGAHADHRQPGGKERGDLPVEIAERGVAVGVLAALHRLGVALKTVVVILEQPGHYVGPHPMTLGGQFLGQFHPSTWSSTAAATSDHPRSQD